jgi:hypothetical protein
MSDRNTEDELMCDEMKHSGGSALVPDFTVTGFDKSRTGVAEAHAKLKDVRALKLSVCVGASYNPTTNQICFSIPIYGDLCVTSPISIPIDGDLKACAETCGSFIPTGVKVTIYLNGNSIFSGTVVGSC